MDRSARGEIVMRRQTKSISGAAQTVGETRDREKRGCRRGRHVQSVEMPAGTASGRKGTFSGAEEQTLGSSDLGFDQIRDKVSGKGCMSSW